MICRYLVISGGDLLANVTSCRCVASVLSLIVSRVDAISYLLLIVSYKVSVYACVLARVYKKTGVGISTVIAL